jgi:hypothetical protein
MTKEKWLQVSGNEDYEVSNRGAVRALPSRRILPAHKGNKVGHRRVSLKSPTTGEHKQHYVHTLVLEAFVSPRPEGMCACHIDGDPLNNCVENLRWGTYSENNHDIVRHGRHHHTKRTHCPKGHPLDAVKFHADGTFWQRRCRTCLREQNRARRARKTTCPKGHPFDGVRRNRDGSVRQRYCTVCAHDALERGRLARWG